MRHSGPRIVEVRSRQQLSSQLLRLELAGDLQDYPHPQPAAHIKLMLPKAGQINPQLPEIVEGKPRWQDPSNKPWVRTYTVRHFDPVEQVMTVDMVLQGQGPAWDWARQARPGSRLAVTLPGGPDPMLPEADLYWLAGDLTALPGIAALLENLPESARGQVWLQTAEDVRHLLGNVPTGIEVHWLSPVSAGLQLLPALQQAERPDGAQLSFWLAGEHHEIVALRSWLRQDLKVAKEHLYAVPYWKRQADEEAYHHERHQVMDEE